MSMLCFLIMKTWSVRLRHKNTAIGLTFSSYILSSMKSLSLFDGYYNNLLILITSNVLTDHDYSYANVVYKIRIPFLYEGFVI